MDISQALGLKAMRAVLEEDVEYQYRCIFRWYSRTFHTPLHITEDLPLEDVLTAYYETTFSELKPEEQKAEIIRLTENATEKSRREREEEVDDIEFLKKAAHDAEEAIKRKKEKEEIEAKKLEKIIDTAPEKPPLAADIDNEPDIQVSYDSHNLKEEDLDDLPSFDAPVK